MIHPAFSSQQHLIHRPTLIRASSATAFFRLLRYVARPEIKTYIPHGGMLLSEALVATRFGLGF